MDRKPARILNMLFFAAGLAALVMMIARFGPSEIGRNLLESWKAILVVVAILGTGLLLGCYAWWLLIPRECRPPMLRLMPAHLAGYALNRLLPSGNLGEIAKFNLVHKAIPFQELAASLLVLTVLGTIVGQVFTLAGALLALLVLPLPQWVGLAMLLVSLGMTALTVGLLVLFRLKLFGRVTASLSRFNRLKGLLRVVEKAQRLDAALDHVSRFDRNDTVKAVALFAAVRLTHVASSAAILASVVPSMTAGDTIVTAFVLCTAGQLIEWTLAIIPAGLGVVEGGSAFIMHALGLGPETGISVALSVRLAGLVLASASLLGFVMPGTGTEQE